MQRAEKEFIEIRFFLLNKNVFCHDSGRHWPNLDDTLGFENWSQGPHSGQISAPGGPKNNPKNKTKKKRFRKISKHADFIFCLSHFCSFGKPILSVTDNGQSPRNIPKAGLRSGLGPCCGRGVGESDSGNPGAQGTGREFCHYHHPGSL